MEGGVEELALTEAPEIDRKVMCVAEESSEEEESVKGSGRV